MANVGANLPYEDVGMGEPNFGKIKKILVANRGEIAVRICRAAHELGLKTVAIYAAEDSLTLHRHRADESYQLKGTSPVGAYLDIAQIISIAKRTKCDAIHPGYGFLSENEAFVNACTDAGIIFIGPTAKVIETFGDKTAAKTLATKCDVPVVPGSDGAVASADDALDFVRAHGLPVMIKAAFGGGGRGMRVVRREDEVAESFQRCVSEAQSAFGDGTVFIERYIDAPRHIEVQILGDSHGGLIHLFERDCSVQRRHQKVIEMAPSRGLSEAVRQGMYSAAVKLGRACGYQNAGTVEFLFDSRDEKYYFIELNPRIQVEHTVTEEICGIDIVAAQIRVAAGMSLEAQGLTQASVCPRGYAIQCRVTAEDPSNGFAPSTGKIEVYVSSSGAGVRLDGATGFAGAVISPFFDSLLVKVTAHADSFDTCRRRLLRALTEFRIYGVTTNLVFLQRVLSDPVFTAEPVTTNFLENRPGLFLPYTHDTGSHKTLQFLADTLVNGPQIPGQHGSPGPIPPPPTAIENVDFPVTDAPPVGLRHLLDSSKGGSPEKFCAAVRERSELLFMDTTWRDAHQSLLMTRVRTHDLLRVAAHTAHLTPELFALEMWGGATFDVALRFLHECPWQRLKVLRDRVSNIPFQMLLRGSNAVGYSSQPDNVVREFVKQAHAHGIDIFRVFDSLNYAPNLRSGIDAVREAGAVCEACLCYTGDVSDDDDSDETLDAPSPPSFSLAYFVQLASELVKMGTHIIGIKDMAGLLRPQAARKLVGALRRRFPKHPIHVHTHDSGGWGVAAMLAAAEAGADVVDGAVDSMSGLTSQPSLGAMLVSTEGTARASALSLHAVQELSRYWSGVRDHYRCFEPGLKSTSSEVVHHEIPGGQLSNLWFQSHSLGLADRWDDIVAAYSAANKLLGNIPKVTPSSKVVGDLAQFMVQNNLTADAFLERASELSVPNSVIDFLSGGLGVPPNGFPETITKALATGGSEGVQSAAQRKAVPLDLAKRLVELKKKHGNWVSLLDALSSAFYPDVFDEFAAHRNQYGDISTLPTHLLLKKMVIGQSVTVKLGTKDADISLLGFGDSVKVDGRRDVFFEFNGETMCVSALDRHADAVQEQRRKASASVVGEVGAPLAGMVVNVRVLEGSHVTAGDPIVVLAAMKIELVVKSPVTGTVRQLFAVTGDSLNSNDLIAIIANDEVKV